MRECEGDEAAFKKGSRANTGQLFREGDRGELVTVFKRTLTDAGDGIGEYQGRKTRAFSEGIFADVG